jgi:hypothetical protein
MERSRKTITYLSLALLATPPLFYLFFYISRLTIDEREGVFAHSNSMEESIANNLFVTQYLPSSDELKLRNNDTVFIRQAWAETMWTYQDGKRKKLEEQGYNFHIYFTSKKTSDFLLHLLDESNQAFTNGMGKNRCILSPRQLKDEIEIILQESNPIDSIAWTQPLTTDTITFTIKHLP